MTEAPPLRVEPIEGGLRFRLDRPAAGNTLTDALVEALHRALDEAEANPQAKVVVLSGSEGVFCTGMDFEEYLAGRESAAERDLGRFPALLARFASTSRVVIAAVDGKVMAGGVGLAAACDLAYATERSTFTLSEALWGLLPCTIAPYLVRRVGFQKAYEMTLSTRTVPAKEAVEIRLADFLVPDVEAAIALQAKRLRRLDPATVLDLKAYFRKLGNLTEGVESAALAELRRLLATDRVRKNIEDYARYGRLPWESW